MRFLEAITKCYRKYIVFRGRAPRSEFWWFFLLWFLFFWPFLLTRFGAPTTFYRILSFIYFLLMLSSLIPLFSVYTRRMHDRGKSGWWWLINLIPVIGLLLSIRWLTTKGGDEPNKYGDPDNGPFTPTNIRTKIEKKQLERELALLEAQSEGSD